MFCCNASGKGPREGPSYYLAKNPCFSLPQAILLAYLYSIKFKITQLRYVAPGTEHVSTSAGLNRQTTHLVIVEFFTDKSLEYRRGDGRIHQEGHQYRNRGVRLSRRTALGISPCRDQVRASQQNKYKHWHESRHEQPVVEVDVDKTTRREHKPQVKGNCSCCTVQEAPVHPGVAGVRNVIKLRKRCDKRTIARFGGYTAPTKSDEYLLQSKNETAARRAHHGAGHTMIKQTWCDIATYCHLSAHMP